ncbi:hypothetical protein [Butyricicoccus pullicaecorum]|uniref:hypothetical protein n=1 Tax=Butyricicoccus pullicaecorum TaxID=501571 RepID=UPI0039906EDB
MYRKYVLRLIGVVVGLLLLSAATVLVLDRRSSITFPCPASKRPTPMSATRMPV